MPAKLIDSGYAGIRLPNGATGNRIENNVIENHGRGLFVLSSSEGNHLRNNTESNTTYQGGLIQSCGNHLEGNTIVDAGDEAIHVVHAVAASTPTPSIANNNTILWNVIRDTQKHAPSRFIGLHISTSGNTELFIG